MVDFILPLEANPRGALPVVSSSFAVTKKRMRVMNSQYYLSFKYIVQSYDRLCLMKKGTII